MTLDDTGYLHCAYLGTDPSMMVTPAPEARDINYEVCTTLGLQECRFTLRQCTSFGGGGGDKD